MAFIVSLKGEKCIYVWYALHMHKVMSMGSNSATGQ
jgi:hypothetical protein